MNQIREIQKINQEELARGIAGTAASWHAKYAGSAWIFLGNVDVKLTEGDVIAVISQYGEVEDLNLVRDEDTGKSKGFAFCKYEDARSCVLAVDNLCGFSLCGRSLRVDHVEHYRLPKHLQEKEEELQQILLQNKGSLAGHAYGGKELANDFTLEKGQDVFAAPKKKDDNQHDNKPADDDPERQARREQRRQEKDKKRLAKEQRKRERDQKRMEREERRREKRAKNLKHDDDANGENQGRSGRKIPRKTKVASEPRSPP